MSNCNSVNPISRCSGKDIKKDLTLNQKEYKLSSSQHTDNKIAMAVINNGNTVAQNQNTPDVNYCVTNVGGPGDNVSSLLVFNKKMPENSRGVDKKNGSYARYLARKRGWNTIKQMCN